MMARLQQASKELLAVDLADRAICGFGGRLAGPNVARHTVVGALVRTFPLEKRA